MTATATHDVTRAPRAALAPAWSPKPTSWAISTAVHVALLVVLATTFGRDRRDRSPEPLTRLVYVEPAPPPAPASGAASDDERPHAAAPPPHAQEPETPPEPVPVPRALEPRAAPHRAPLAAHARKPAASPPVAASEAMPNAPAETAPPLGAADAARDATNEADARTETAAGARGGVVGGAAGGLGSAPVALRSVAAPPELVRRIMPEYPARARARDVEGQVVLEVILDQTGRIEDAIRVVQSVPLLDEAAVAAVKQWRFRPARDRAGEPVRVLMEIPVRFVLR